jgi:hypothetical protein
LIPSHCRALGWLLGLRFVNWHVLVQRNQLVYDEKVKAGPFSKLCHRAENYDFRVGRSLNLFSYNLNLRFQIGNFMVRQWLPQALVDAGDDLMKLEF